MPASLEGRQISFKSVTCACCVRAGPLENLAKRRSSAFERCSARTAVGRRCAKVARLTLVRRERSHIDVSADVVDVTEHCGMISKER